AARCRNRRRRSFILNLPVREQPSSRVAREEFGVPAVYAQHFDMKRREFHHLAWRGSSAGVQKKFVGPHLGSCSAGSIGTRGPVSRSTVRCARSRPEGPKATWTILLGTPPARLRFSPAT